MALRYWVTGGTGNWDSTTNWSTASGGASGAAVPTTADDTVFDANSGAGNVIVNITTALVISTTFTDFVGTLVVNNILQSRGVVLGTGMSFNTTAGTPILRMSGTCTYTSNGVTWPYTLELGDGATTLTLNDNITVQNLNRISTTTSGLIINGNTLIILGDFSFSATGTTATAGTTTISLEGTGTWSSVGSGPWRNNLTINTAGTITVSGNVRYNTGVLTYTAGTVVTTGSVVNVNAPVTFNTNGITWNNISTAFTGTFTLTSDLTTNLFLIFSGVMTLAGDGIFQPTTLNFSTGASGLTLNRDITITNFTKISGTGNNTITNNTITITGNIDTGTATGVKLGTTNILYTGTGTWTGTATGNTTYNFTGADFTINTAGTLTIAGRVGVGTGTFNYIAGTITITTGVLLIDRAVTLNVDGITWNDIIIAGASYAITLGEDLNVSGATTLVSTGTVTFTLGGNSLNLTDLIATSGTYTIPTTLNINNATLITTTTNVTLNTNTINISGNLTTAGTGVCLGTTTLVLNGTGTWDNSSTGVIRNNLTINTAGTITVSGIVRYNTGTITYTAGTVVTTGSTLNITLSTTLNTSGITWNNINPNVNTLTLTLTSALDANTLTFNSSTTFDTNGFTVGTLIVAAAGLTIQLPSTQTSTITTNFTCILATNASRILFRSTTGGSKALLNLDSAATQKLAFVNATDLNSLGGKTIYSFDGVFTNTDNWQVLPGEPGGEASFTFVN